ncbi:MAG: PCYCGC motif-containing (lipo)protein [Chloroflexota bacterium]
MKRRQLLAAAAAALVTGCTQRAATPSPTPYPVALAANPLKGIWPTAYRTAPEAVRTAYEYAALNYETLRYVPCFCGCGLSAGHLNNYDCFVKAAKPDGWFILDPHGLGCGTCVAITLEVIAMREQGLLVRSIRAAVDDRWAKTGPATKTPYP